MCLYSKIHDYSPSESSKVYSKPVTRRPGVAFNPHQVVDLVRLGTVPSCTTQSDRLKIVTAYIEVLVSFLLHYVVAGVLLSALWCNMVWTCIETFKILRFCLSADLWMGKVI